MTITIPDGVATLGAESVYWVPAIANPATGATVAELNAGTPIQCAINSFAPNGDQGSSQDLRLCSVDELENPGRNKITISAIELVYDPQMPTNTTAYAAYSALAPRAKGFLVDRRGMPHAQAFAAGQFVDIYTVTLGERNRVAITAGSDGEKFKTSIKPFVSGARYLDKAVVA
ncbi:MAG: hypothetical protein IPM11_01080 [Micropruina sp.]|nr:hypothetical protein [Micropruina sp.]